MIISVAIAVVALVVDQLTKFWAQHSLQPVRDIPLWDGVFHLHYARNTGAAFSMLEGHNWLFFIFTVVVVAGMVWYLFRHRRDMHPLLRVALGLIIGGALGNFIDRVTLGYVVDFLYFKLINFAIFNVADSALVIGCILMGIYILFIHEKYTHRANQPGEEEHGAGNNQPAG